MEITAEISYYPLHDDYAKLVTAFIQQLSEQPDIKINTGVTSSFISGGYNEIMLALKETMQPFLEKYASVFKITLSSACTKCEK